MGVRDELEFKIPLEHLGACFIQKCQKEKEDKKVTTIKMRAIICSNPIILHVLQKIPLEIFPALPFRLRGC